MEGEDQASTTLRPISPDSPKTNRDEADSTVIIGAGIIGCATAYYLSNSGGTAPDSIHLIEASEELFASASGRAGGFVAEDWFESATASLGSLSFKLHEELAREHDGGQGWGYSRTTGISLAIDRGDEFDSEDAKDWLNAGGSRANAASQHQQPAAHEFFTDASGPSWLRKKMGYSISNITEPGGAAQVDPLKLSQFLLRQSLARGVRLHNPARPTHVALDDSGKISGLRIRHTSGNEDEIPCTKLLITAGAWTPRVFASLFPNSPTIIPVTHLAGHSVVLGSPRWTSQQDCCHALFAMLPQYAFSPEIFSRMGQEIYIAGLNSPSIALPDLPSGARIEPRAIRELMCLAQQLLGNEGEDDSDLKLIRDGVCFRPTTISGDPILVNLNNEQLGIAVSTPDDGNSGVFVCAGHGPWGISLSLGSGKVMSEMLEGKQTSADVLNLGLH